VTIIRYAEVDLSTGAISTNEARGALADDYDSLRARIESRPGMAFVPLTPHDLFIADVEAFSDEFVAGLVSPHETVVRLPSPDEVEYDPETKWFKPKPRPSVDEAIGTLESLVDGMVARGVNRNLAEITAQARRDEYEAYDPLGGVYQYTATKEDILTSFARDTVDLGNSEKQSVA
jgi:hypothetical protein